MKLFDNKKYLKDLLESLDCGHWIIKQYDRSFVALRPQKLDLTQKDVKKSSMRTSRIKDTQ